MHPSTAMQQSSACGPRQLFLYSDQGGEEKKEEEEEEVEEEEENKKGRGGDHNSNTIFPSNEAELYSWAKAIVSLQ